MPHVAIEEALDLGLACQGIKLAAVRSGSEILKVVDVYLKPVVPHGPGRLRRDRGRSLATFFVQLSQKDRQITVRLLPATDPEKTVGVKRVMALIARQLHDAIGGSRFGKTNLQEYLQ